MNFNIEIAYAAITIIFLFISWRMARNLKFIKTDMRKKLSNHSESLLENSSSARINRELIRNLQEEHIMLTESLLENNSSARTNRKLIRNLQEEHIILIRNLQEEHIMLKKKLELLQQDHMDWVRRLKGEPVHFGPNPGG